MVDDFTTAMNSSHRRHDAVPCLPTRTMMKVVANLSLSLLLFLFSWLMLTTPGTWAFSFGRPLDVVSPARRMANRISPIKPTWKHFQQSSSTRLGMVRNIDLVEALIFYGRDSILDLDDDSTQSEDGISFRDGVKSLLTECHDDGTSVISILEDQEQDDGPNLATIQEYFTMKSPATIFTFPMTTPAPSPKDVWASIHSIPNIQPKGFGGSAGFGARPADPERGPLPRHCVVLCSTEHQCRAARYAGMRVLCLTDNLLADAVLDLDGWSYLYMDDIATPGSYWLNPPHPRDDKGDAVDVDLVIRAYVEQLNGINKQEEDDTSTKESTMEEKVPPVLSASDFVEDDQLSDIELAQMLADIDPL